VTSEEKIHPSSAQQLKNLKGPTSLNLTKPPTNLKY